MTCFLQLVDELRCSECGFTRRRVDACLDVELAVGCGITSVPQSLERFGAAETLSGDNQWFCETCSKKVDAQKALRIAALPSVLTLHLKRYVSLHSLWHNVIAHAAPTNAANTT